MDFDLCIKNDNLKIYCSSSLKDFSNEFIEYYNQNIEHIKKELSIDEDIKLIVALTDNLDQANFVYGKSDFSGFFNDTGAFAYINLNGSKTKDYMFKGLMHELIHHLYKYYVYGKNNERITWVDEGIAQFFSNQKDELEDKNKYLLFVRENLKTDGNINLNKLNHDDKSFGNNNGYNLSYIAIRHLCETKTHDEFIDIIKNRDKLLEYGNRIFSDISFIPKLKFRSMTLEENIDTIKWSFFEENGSINVHKYVIEYFPELASLDINSSKDDIYKRIEEVVTADYNKYKTKMDSEAERYNLLWNEYNDKYFYLLSSYLGVDWPSNISEITATVGLTPIFPRNIDDFSFSVGTNMDDLKLISTCAHETLHFLWFEKWKQLHPETSREEYDAPHIVWKYSEMVTDPILNNKPFSDLFNFTEKGYDSFYELYDNGMRVMDNLRSIYSKNMSIDDKINSGFSYISKLFEDKLDTTKSM